MKKSNYFLIFLWIVSISLIIIHFWPVSVSKVPDNAPKVEISTIPINYSNLEKELAKSSIVRAIPSEKQILLKFYSFKSGEKVWEKNYLLSSGKIVLTNASTAPIVLVLSSKYLEKLTNKNFCSVLKEANSNGDLGFETKESLVKLAWEFRSMKEYKKCV